METQAQSLRMAEAQFEQEKRKRAEEMQAAKEKYDASVRVRRNAHMEAAALHRESESERRRVSSRSRHGARRPFAQTRKRIRMTLMRRSRPGRRLPVPTQSSWYAAMACLMASTPPMVAHFDVC